MRESDIVRWQVKSLDRARRGIDEWIALATPWLRRWLVSRAMRQPAGSDLRRKLLTRGVRVAAAANNREDYDSMLVAYHPDVELIPPEGGESAIGLDRVYRGHAGVRRFFETWKSGFGEHRYEVREVADAGGRHFAVRFGLAGRIGDSATEVVTELANVNTLKHGLVVRQENFRSWETALDALRRASNG